MVGRVVDEAGWQSARLVFLVVLVGFLFACAYLTWRSAILQPYSDMLDWLDRYNQFNRHGGLLQYLLAPHNFNRMAWTFAAIALDARLFGANNIGFIAYDALCLAGVAVLLAREASVGVGPLLRLPVAGFAIMLALMPGNILDASIPINGTYVQCLLFSLLAIALGERTGQKTQLSLRHTGALVCFVAATLGSAAGFAVWPVMMFGAWRGGGSRLWLLLLFVAGAGYCLLYTMGNSLPGGTSGGWTLDKFVGMISFGLTYLALPWTRAFLGLGWFAGLVVLIVGIAALLRRGGGSASRSERLATQFILYSLATAVMAMIARGDHGGGANVPLRYGIFMVPLHVGLLILAAPYLANWRARQPRLADIAVVAAGLLMLTQQGVMGRAIIRAADTNRNLIAAFRAGQRTPAMTVTIHPDLAHATAIRLRLDEEGLYTRELHLRELPN